MPAPPPSRVQVVHATAPGCTWSWGYEPVLNRLRLVYGDQIDIHLRIGCPYDDWEQWLVDYGMTMDEAMQWLRESAEGMGVPMPVVTPANVPKNVWPATLAVLAAMRQGEEKGWRMNRAMLRRVVVELQDPREERFVLDAAREAGLDVARFLRDSQDEEGLREEQARRDEKMPPVHVGFYNIVVTDGGNRRVTLDYCFEPREVEGAIDYLSGGGLHKARPTDVAAYVRAYPCASVIEVARVFAMEPDAAQRALEKLEKDGHAERVTLAGAPHWRAT